MFKQPKEKRGIAMTLINCVLLIENDTITNFINRRVLEKANLAKEIKIAMNGYEGINAVIEHCVENDNNCPELILLDLNMPIMDGFEFLQAYNKLTFKNKHQVSIVMLTSSTNPRDLNMLKELGINDHLGKPLDNDKVNRIINIIKSQTCNIE